MDIFNDNWKEYIRSDDKLLANTKIKTSAYVIKSLLMTLWTWMLFGLMTIGAFIEKKTGSLNGKHLNLEFFPVMVMLFLLIWLLYTLHYKSYRLSTACTKSAACCSSTSNS
jgi:hypothetical protein